MKVLKIEQLKKGAHFRVPYKSLFLSGLPHTRDVWVFVGYCIQFNSYKSCKLGHPNISRYHDKGTLVEVDFDF